MHLHFLVCVCVCVCVDILHGQNYSCFRRYVAYAPRFPICNCISQRRACSDIAYWHASWFLHYFVSECNTSLHTCAFVILFSSIELCFSFCIESDTCRHTGMHHDFCTLSVSATLAYTLCILFSLNRTLFLFLHRVRYVQTYWHASWQFLHFVSELTHLCICNTLLLNRTLFLFLHQRHAYTGMRYNYIPPAQV